MESIVIDFIKSIKPFDLVKFHGNRKKVGLLTIANYISIVNKKTTRYKKYNLFVKKTNVQLVRECLIENLGRKNTPYFKIMIEGNTGIYLCSPNYLHQDYNKIRLFEKTEGTLKLMNLYNKFVKNKSK